MAENNDILEQVKERILSAENILVALSKNPSVDEMAGAIGLTLALDGAGKHATAIYSGQTPDVLRFLNPDETFEADTNSLQDFIIALNKEKADHLRYKVEGDYVRVYITPYKTRISEQDLEFSHGDFNVDLVVALNIETAENLDAALSEYGRIMHDATSINITTGQAGNFAELLWSDPAKSSVCEMLVGLLSAMKEVKFEKDIATALMTGIVAATDRFSNDRTTPETMGVAAQLMRDGADQKLIADNMEMNRPGLFGEGVKSEAAGDGGATQVSGGNDGGLEIGHEGVGNEAMNDGGGNVGAENTVEKSEAKSATEQLEQMIAPPAEDAALEQLRQVANDVKPPEFEPGQNPAQVVAPAMTEKEANDIPEINFGGGDAVNITPPEEKGDGGQAGTTPQIGGDAVNIVPPEEQAKDETKKEDVQAQNQDQGQDKEQGQEQSVDDMPIMGLEDIQLPPPPAPPVDLGNGDVTDLPKIEMKEAQTLTEEPASTGEGINGDGGGNNDGNGDGGMENANGGEGASVGDGASGDASGTGESLVDDPTAFKIPGM